MHVAILTFDGFNELDSLIAYGMINRVKRAGWRATIACPGEVATSMNGLVVRAQATPEACEVDAVIVGSGVRTREIARNREMMGQPFHARGKAATSGGCLGSHYLAARLIARSGGEDAARAVLHHAAPVGEKDAWVERAMARVIPFLSPARAHA